MKIEVRELMDENEMLSHIFLGCIPRNKIIEIRDKYVGVDDKAIDWQKESVKIPVEMKIGGVKVNPKEFFDEWKKQIQQLILEKAQELVAEKLGSKKMRDMANRLYDYEQVLNSWENDINWNVKNPFTEIPVTVYPSFWFMRDNHTFIKPFGNTLDEIRISMLEIANENPYGMVCPVKILDENDKEIRHVGGLTHVNKDGFVDLSTWYEAVRNDYDIDIFFKKNKN